MKADKKRLEWVCDTCGITHGNWYKKGIYTGPKTHYATFHMGTCDICNVSNVPVTQPRDYGHIKLD